MYRLDTTSDFDRDFKSLDHDIAERISKKLEWLSANPQSLRFPLKHVPRDLKGLQKYRVGDYRVFCWVDHENETITLYGIEHRRTAYDRFKK